MSKHHKEQPVLIFGLHAVQALLDHAPERVLHLFVQQERHDQRLQAVESRAVGHGISLQRVSRQRLDKMQSGNVHQGIIAEIRPAAALRESDLAGIVEKTELPLLLILDGVQDPHNLGACLRTAEAAGAHAVITTRDKAADLSATVRKAASGAAERVPFVKVVNLSRTMKALQQQGVWIIGAAGEAPERYCDVAMNQPVALVLGAEGSGLRRLTAEHCDKLVRIPMYGQVESLNVSVAAGIVLFEAARQRHP